MIYLSMALVVIACVAGAVVLGINGHPWLCVFCLLAATTVETWPRVYQKSCDELERQTEGR